MYKLRYSGKLGLILGLMAIITASCAESKASQCQKVFAIANQAANDTQALTKEVDQVAWLQAADQVEQAAKNLQTLTLKDTQLQTYQQDFVKIYQEYAQATRAFLEAKDKKDIEGVKAAQKRVQEAGKLEKTSGAAILSYCQQ